MSVGMEMVGRLNAEKDALMVALFNLSVDADAICGDIASSREARRLLARLGNSALVSSLSDAAIAASARKLARSYRAWQQRKSESWLQDMWDLQRLVEGQTDVHDGTTHYEGCERVHHACALERLSRALEARDAERLALVEAGIHEGEGECYRLPGDAERIVREVIAAREDGK